MRHRCEGGAFLRRSGFRFAALIGAALVLSAQAEPPGAVFNRILGEARAARERQDYAAYLANVHMLAAILPGNASIHYSIARGQSLTGDRAGALVTLGRLAELGFAYDVAADASFAGMRDEPALTAVAARLAANVAPRGHASPPRALGLAGQQPEGVASLGGGAFLVGALRGGIYRVDPGAAARQIATAGAAVVGIRPDPASGTFLACVSDETARRSMVQRRRIADGALLAMYPLPAAGTFCNDIALIPGGFVATDSDTGTLYRLQDGRLEALPGVSVLFANGIAADPSGDRLYVASGGGVFTVELATGRSRPLAPAQLLGGIDGMVWHDGALIAVQNVVTPARLLRIVPSSDGADARVDVLLSGHPQLVGATTVAVDDGEAVVLGQTGIPNGSLPDDPILLRVPLAGR
jgi:hypothetical protein